MFIKIKNIIKHEPINIFIGSSSMGEDESIETIYRHSLIKNNSAPLTIHWMRQTNIKSSFYHGFKTERWSTPFSGFRWTIPESCEFKGKAIYTDVDMINFRDINELYSIDLQGKPVAARRGIRFGGHEFCVMVFDCEKMKEYLIPVERQKEIPEYHHRMIAKFSGNDNLVQEIDPRWNCLDGEDRDLKDIWQLHFTNMSTQPWKPSWYKGEIKEHPRKDIIKLYYKLHSEAFQSRVYTPSYEKDINYNIIGK